MVLLLDFPPLDRESQSSSVAIAIYAVDFNLMYGHIVVIAKQTGKFIGAL